MMIDLKNDYALQDLYQQLQATENLQKRLLKAIENRKVELALQYQESSGVEGCLGSQRAEVSLRAVFIKNLGTLQGLAAIAASRAIMCIRALMFLKVLRNIRLLRNPLALKAILACMVLLTVGLGG